MLRIMKTNVKRSYISDDCGDSILALICLCRVLILANEKQVSMLFKPLFFVFLHLQLNFLT